MPNPENLESHKWEKGQSGNPSGRPKGSRNRSTIVRELLDMVIKSPDPLKVIGKDDEEILEALGMTPEEARMIEENAETVITLSMIAKAKSGDVNAYKALMDSAYGTPKQTIEHSDKQTQPLDIEFTKQGDEKDEKPE